MEGTAEQEHIVSLETIAEGAAVAKFNRELQRVLDNIAGAGPGRRHHGLVRQAGRKECGRRGKKRRD